MGAGVTGSVALLTGGPGPRVVGMAARDRNERVAARGDAEVVQDEASDAVAAASEVLVVPATVTLARDAFARLPPVGELVRLVGDGGRAELLWGRGPDVAAHLAASETERPAPPTQPLDDGLAFDLSTPERVRATEKALLLQTVKPTDGLVSVHLNRPFSRFFSERLLRLGWKADHASIVCLAIGVGSAIFAAQTGWWTMVMAGLLFHMASAWDGVDGEMARVTLSESPRGAWIDTAVDNTTYVACLIGIVIGWMREGVGAGGITLAVLVVLGVPALLGLLGTLVTRYGPDGSFVFVDRTVERAARDTGDPTLKLARLCFHAFRRDIFSLLFFVVSLTGVRAAIPGAVALALLIAGGTLALHWPRLVDAAKALQADAATG